MSAFTRPGSRHVHTKLSHKEYIDPFAVPLELMLLLPKHILVNLPPKPLETSLLLAWSAFPNGRLKMRSRTRKNQTYYVYTYMLYILYRSGAIPLLPCLTIDLRGNLHMIYASSRKQLLCYVRTINAK